MTDWWMNSRRGQKSCAFFRALGVLFILSTKIANFAGPCLLAQLNLEDLLGLARVYHYDMIYFGYDFDHESYFISGFE